MSTMGPSCSKLPVETWLGASGGCDRRVLGRVHRGRWSVVLQDAHGVHGRGAGTSFDEAAAGALNDVFARQHVEEEVADECDRVFAAQRRAGL